eukprot:138724_1
MHVYFIHSYDINRLKLRQINAINNHLSQLKQVDSVLFANKKIEMESILMDQKRKQLTKMNKHKYVDGVSSSAEIDCQAIQELIAANGITTDIFDVQSTFIEYKNDKNAFIDDIVDLYFDENDKQHKQPNKLKKHLHCNETIKKKICSNILFKHFKHHDLNKNNFIKIAVGTIKSSPKFKSIDVNQFKLIANSSSKLNGRIFIKHEKEFKNAAKFAQIFASMKQKKLLTKLYAKIKPWKPITVTKKSEYVSNKIQQTEPKLNEVNESHALCCENTQEVKDMKMDEKMEDNSVSIKNNNDQDVYEIGIGFWYWPSMKKHPNYVEPTYVNLKEELLHNEIIGIRFDIKQWKLLQTECATDILTNKVRKLEANGFYSPIYNIQKSSPFSSYHLSCLKLYTDYSKESGLFCSTLRSEIRQQIKNVANWAKLLIECVQCYGSRFKNVKNIHYYRGVKKEFMFRMFVSRFNLPTSTTRDFHKAAGFSNDGGLIMELRNALDRYNQTNVFKFDCSILSAFDDERETLFFGGETVLRISQIWQIYNDKWNSHLNHFIEPTNAILRMINGLTVKQQRILRYDKHQKKK